MTTEQMDQDKKRAVLEGYEPLFQQAEAEKLWFWCDYQNIWLSPQELRECHKKNQFLWSTNNWQLRNPEEELLRLEARAIAAQKDVERYKSRMEKYR